MRLLPTAANPSPPERHRGLRADRDRGPCLPPGDPPATLPADSACHGTTTSTAPPAPKLIPKARYGISVWVEILLDKYHSYRPTERLLTSWRLLGSDLAAGTVTDGLERLEILLRPIYEALKERNPQGGLAPGPMRRGGGCSSPSKGKEGLGWWLWVAKPGHGDLSARGQPCSRGLEGHFGAESGGAVVDRHAGLQGDGWVKDGVLVLAFCWAHVRRDFPVRVGKGWPELKAWPWNGCGGFALLYRLKSTGQIGGP